MREPGFYWVRDAVDSEPEVARFDGERWFWATFYDAEDVPIEVLSPRLEPPPGGVSPKAEPQTELDRLIEQMFWLASAAGFNARVQLTRPRAKAAPKRAKR